MFYPNSDFSKDRYCFKDQFKEDRYRAFKSGKAVYYNYLRKLNNCRYARVLKGYISIQDIFLKKWNEFKDKYYHLLLRPNLIKTIEDFMKCHNPKVGYLFFECPTCNNFHIVPNSCHTRFCPSCGKKYRDKRAIKTSEKCINVPHRQFVFTIPEELRKHFRRYRSMLSLLFLSVKETLEICLRHYSKKKYKIEERKLGFISFLHTYGRDLKWHPHIHALIAERYVDKYGEYHKFDFFSFDFIRITFQNVLFDKIYKYYKENIKDRKEIGEMYLLLKKLKEKYPNGYYFYGKKNKDNSSSIKGIKAVTNYIARYASHPAISEKRIISVDYDNNLITWFYDPHEDDDIEDEELKIGRQIITEDIFDFMKRIIVHIPSKSFHQIRYYGFYSNKFKLKEKYNKLFATLELNRMKSLTYHINGLKKSYGYNPLLCVCGSIMILNRNKSFLRGWRDYG